MHNYIWPNCGAFLDPGERCECQERQQVNEPVEQNKENKELIAC